MADGALVALRRFAHAESFGDSFAAFGNESAVSARVDVGFLPDEHLVVALATAVTSGGSAALPAEESILRASDCEANEESYEATHAWCINGSLAVRQARRWMEIQATFCSGRWTLWCARLSHAPYVLD